MAQGNCQKIKLLKLMELLRQETDELHPLSTNDVWLTHSGRYLARYFIMVRRWRSQYLRYYHLAKCWWLNLSDCTQYQKQEDCQFSFGIYRSPV